MWFGTRYGLDQYDGNSFTVYLPTTEGDVFKAITSMSFIKITPVTYGSAHMLMLCVWI